jgi:hypothetical protein
VKLIKKTLFQIVSTVPKVFRMMLRPFLEMKMSLLKKNSSKNRPLSIAPTVSSSNKKQRNIPYEYAMSDYRNKKEELAVEAAEEVRRHNRAMEAIALTTADIEKTKKSIEMESIAQSAQLDNDKKSFNYVFRNATLSLT